MRFSFGLQPVYPSPEALELFRTADELGFHGCFVADDPSSRDPWVLCGAAARETESVRLGPSATHVYLRDPTLIAQALATLDELTDGRVEAVVSFGDPAILDTYHVDWRGKRPLARVREAITVMRACLDEREVTHDGEFFHYSGLSASARPVQERLPLLIGAVGGPRSFQLAGEVSDGVHCVGCSRENAQFVVEQVAKGAERAGRDWRELDLAAACVTAVAEDSAAAKEAARVIIAGWIPSLPQNLVERHGLDYAEVAPIARAMTEGDAEEALRLTTPEIADALTLAGTPEECADRIRTDFEDAGIDHVVMALVDPFLVEAYAERRVEGVPDARDQLRLIRDRVFPAFSDSSV